MIKKIIALILPIAIFLGGCSSFTDYTEPENRIVVTAMFIKYENTDFEISLETVKVDKEDSQEKYITDYLVGKGKTVYKAVEDIQSEISKEISLYHCPLIICETKTLSNKRNELLDYIIKNHQLSLAAKLVLTENFNALIENKNDDTVFLGYEISDMLSLKNINSDIINILRGRENAPVIAVDSINKFIVSEN